jgi:alkylation response protein AidB-like acyl-CoA dehydrogenase
MSSNPSPAAGTTPTAGPTPTPTSTPTTPGASGPHAPSAAAADPALDHLDWPFFEGRHRRFAESLDAWARAALADAPHPHDREAVDARCRDMVRQLGRDGWLRHAVAGVAHGGASDLLDTRMLCLARETLARHDGLADFAFAMQGLGSGAISLAGTDDQRARWLPRVARGEAIAAFALSEPDAGSDVAALQCAARVEGDHAVLDGTKTWISNGGIADVYVVFVREHAGDGPGGGMTEAARRGTRDIGAYVVEAGTPGFEIAERLDVIAPHPLATLRFANCRVPLAQRLGPAGEGFKIAMRTLDVFRTSVAAAALGFARRALAEGLDRSLARRMFDARLADFQLTQARLAQMATTVDAAALLTYRAAWRRDQGHGVTREAAMAKLAATEGAQQVIDAAVQLFGGLGVKSGETVERLYREIRALRIYEGASEVQQLIIGRELVKAAERSGR